MRRSRGTRITEVSYSSQPWASQNRNIVSRQVGTQQALYSQTALHPTLFQSVEWFAHRSFSFSKFLSHNLCPCLPTVLLPIGTNRDPATLFSGGHLPGPLHVHGPPWLLCSWWRSQQPLRHWKGPKGLGCSQAPRRDKRGTVKPAS